MTMALALRARRHARNLGVAALSLVLMVGVGWYTIAPTEPAFAATVSSHGVAPGNDPVVYGTVISATAPISRVLVCARSLKIMPRVTACTFTDKFGVYRLQFLGPTAQYQISFVKGETSGRVNVRIRSGEVLNVSAVRVHRERFVPFPVSSY